MQGRIALEANVVAGDPARLELLARAPVSRGVRDDLDFARRKGVRVLGGLVVGIVVEEAVAVAEDHPGVEELLERLLRVHELEIEEHLVPEPAVEQVQHRVLGAADVEVDGHPVARTRAPRRWSGRRSAGSTSSCRPTGAWCSCRGGPGARWRDRSSPPNPLRGRAAVRTRHSA